MGVAWAMTSAERVGGVEDVLNPITHLESICASLAVGRTRTVRAFETHASHMKREQAAQAE